jgi:hypothetical protein
MPDSYYYQDNNGQIVGPLTPQALKQLANQGTVTENTLVRKGEQGAWYLAGTIAGLLPSRPAGSEGFSMPEKDPAERARQAFQKAEEHADKVAAKLWFLDLKFAHFFTPKLAGALWAIFLCLIAIEFLISFFQSLALLPAHPFVSLGGMLLALVGLVFGVVCSRVVLEVLLVTFRIAERLENLKHLEYLKHLENHSPPSAGVGGGFTPTAPGPNR